MRILPVPLSVRFLPVCPSVKRVNCDKTDQIFTPHERLFSQVFWKIWLMGGDRPILPEILGLKSAPVGAKSPILNRYSLVAPQPWHLSKKSSINTSRKSTACFRMSPRWSSYVAPKPHLPKGGSKTQNGGFWFKIALRLKKVCYKVSLCENCQR